MSGCALHIHVCKKVLAGVLCFLHTCVYAHGCDQRCARLHAQMSVHGAVDSAGVAHVGVHGCVHALQRFVHACGRVCKDEVVRVLIKL